jgi:hypothetical protein
VEVAVSTTTAWVAAYFTAWRTNDASAVESLFSENAVYYYGPFRPPAVGRDEIVRRWVRNGPPGDFTAQWEVIAVAGEVGVIHWKVSFRDGGALTTMDGVLIVRFDEHGRCREHREWYVEQRT